MSLSGINKDDYKFSLAVRERDFYRCRYGLPGCFTKASEVSHIFTRACQALRMDMRNGVSACRSCHLYIESNPKKAKEIHTKLLGHVYAEIESIFMKNYYGL